MMSDTSDTSDTSDLSDKLLHKTCKIYQIVVQRKYREAHTNLCSFCISPYQCV